MIKVLLLDFARTLLFPVDESYRGGLNLLHRKLSKQEDYVFADHFRLNEPLLEYLDQRKKRFRLYVFTTGKIQETLEIKKRLNKIFVQVFSSQDIGYFKNDPKAFDYLAHKLVVKPEEMLFIDDRELNLDAARRSRVKTIKFVGNENLFKRLGPILN
ncbi:HAD-IA family hydrolase [Patescibacteria group bacterium]|nr:HAD-IA family hydrolase [Patescibacteria group bacterium]